MQGRGGESCRGAGVSHAGMPPPPAPPPPPLPALLPCPRPLPHPHLPACLPSLLLLPVGARVPGHIFPLLLPVGARVPCIPRIMHACYCLATACRRTCPLRPSRRAASPDPSNGASRAPCLLDLRRAASPRLTQRPGGARGRGRAKRTPCTVCLRWVGVRAGGGEGG